MAGCRAITLINYHIPMAEDIKNADMNADIKYITMGFFDGMMTKKIELSEHDLNQKNLWEYELFRTAESEGKYSYQNIICFECDKKSTYTDEEMWSEETDKLFPLTFLTFLQLEDYVVGQDAINEQCLKFNDKVGQILESGKYYTYKTVDKNDFVVCIKCRSYKKAVGVIKQLHQIEDCNIIYSYTVFSVSKKVLNLFAQIEYEDIYNEKINSICLKGIANSSCKNADISLDTKYREFGKMLLEKIYKDEENKDHDAKIYDILGDNDFRLIARDVKLGRILCEFGQGGMLNHYENIFSSYLFSSSLLLNTVEDDEQGKINTGLIMKTKAEIGEDYVTPKCDELENRLSWISGVIKRMKDMENINELYWNTTATMCSGIWQLLQSLKALERPKTKKYDFLTIFAPLSQMIKILEKKIEDDEKNSVIANRAKIFDFLHKISMTLHGTLRTDIQFFQIRDFNAVIHYAPAKLRAFYSLWALKLSDYYSRFCDEKSKKTYSFIFSPGMFPEIGVKQLFDSDKDKHRLMLITLPERQLYTLQKLSIILGHEVSHFVGTDIKCRYERYICLINVVSRILSLEINSLRYRKTEPQYREAAEKMIANSSLFDRLNELLFWENDLFVEEQSSLILHSDKTVSSIIDLFDLVLNKYTEMFVGEDCEYYYQNFKSLSFRNNIDANEESIEVIQKTLSMSYTLDQNILVLIRRYSGSIKSFLEQILNEVLREVCADISSILTLESTPDEYIKSFCNVGQPDKSQELDKDILSEKEIRIFLVINSIKKKINGNEVCFINKEFVEAWNSFHIKKYVEDNEIGSEEEILGYKIFLCSKIKKDKNDKISEYKSAYNDNKEYFTGKVFDFYTDNIVMESIENYIESCIEVYLHKLWEGDQSLLEQKEVLVETYYNIANTSVGMQIQTIEDFLDYCEKK